MKETPKLTDCVSRIMDYEGGLLSGEEIISLFQDLIDSRVVWSLQGHYGRTADALIAAKLCSDGD